MYDFHYCTNAEVFTISHDERIIFFLVPPLFFNVNLFTNILIFSYTEDVHGALSCYHALQILSNCSACIIIKIYALIAL